MHITTTRRLTKQAQSALALARQEAADLKHDYIGTEHLLLGMLRERDGRAAEVLRAHGLELERARAAVRSLVGDWDRPSPRELVLTWRAIHVLDLAFVSARRRMPYRRRGWRIGTEHLLLCLVLDERDVAVRVLANLGVRHTVLQAQLRQLLHQANLQAEQGCLDVLR